MSKAAVEAEKDRRREAGLKLFGYPYDDRQTVKSRGGLWDGDEEVKCWLLPDETTLISLGAERMHGQYGPYWAIPKEENGNGSSPQTPTGAKVVQKDESFTIYLLSNDTGYIDEALAQHMARTLDLTITKVMVDPNVLEISPVEVAPPAAPPVPADVTFKIGGPCSKCGEPIGEDELCTACRWPALFG